jgi:hypothetical protein
VTTCEARIRENRGSPERIPLIDACSIQSSSLSTVVELLTLFGFTAIYRYATIPVQMACPAPTKRRSCLHRWGLLCSRTELLPIGLGRGAAKIPLDPQNIGIQETGR